MKFKFAWTDIHWPEVARSFIPTRPLHFGLYIASVVIYGGFLAAYLSFEGSGIEADMSWASTSCFSADTQITMADGSTRPIAEVRPGDLVLRPDGGANRVVAIERPRLGQRKLYGVDGFAPFFTAEHPFLSGDGWKALAPRLTAAETPGLAVTPLRVGDRLIRLGPRRWASGGEGDCAPPRRSTLTVTRLAAASESPQTRVYNLILDGDHRYIANGFIVHNKTIDREAKLGEQEDPDRRGRRKKRNKRKKKGAYDSYDEGAEDDGYDDEAADDARAGKKDWDGADPDKED